MSWVKVKDMSSINNEMLHDTIMKLKMYAKEFGREDTLYKSLHSEIVDMAKEIVETDNIVIPITLNSEDSVVVMVELEMLDDGKNYRVVKFEQGEDNSDDSYVEIVAID